MVVAQKVKEAEITEQDSLLLTRNLLRIAIFNISYIRGLFPEKYFNDKSVPALEMKIKKLMPMDAESRRLIDWMEKGVYDALQKKYLRMLLFCICEKIDGPMLEEYTFSFSYSNSDSQEVSMNINRTGNKNQGTAFKSSDCTDVTPNQMRSSACKMIRTLVQLMRTLDQMPEERIIVMKLLYYDDVTPADYEPPFFRSCSIDEANNPWTKKPLKMEVGNVNSKHFLLALKVKSVLDPCEDENDDIQEDEEVSLGADSEHQRDSSDSDSEVNHSLEGDQYIVAPVGKHPLHDDDCMVDEDNTQDPEEDKQQLERVKEWIGLHHIATVELTDVLSNFPDISMALIEEIMEKLKDEGFLSRTARDVYAINKQKKFDPSLDDVKEEMDEQGSPIAGKGQQKVDEDYLYMKALYHALPMDYVTVTKLQSKLEGEVNQTTVRKLIDKMAVDGFIEGKGNRRLGKRVIHSELTNRKLTEVKKTLDHTASAMELSESSKQSNRNNGTNRKDTSTCAGLHSFGSDQTHTRGRSNADKNGLSRNEREQGNTPISMAEPVASRESMVPRNDNRVANRRIAHHDEGDTTTCGRSTQEKRARKTSTVKEPIVQYAKRQKAQAA